MKRTLAAAAALAMALTVAACGSSGDDAGTTSAGAGTTAAATSAAESPAESSAAESPAESSAEESPAESSAAESSGGEAGGELPPIDEAALDGAVVGFAQVGSESGWRSANTDDIKATAEKYKVDLQFTSAEGDQAKQIASLKTFIAQGVDVIAFSPVVETGWDAVLEEAKAADIPVILTDRAVDADASLYRTFIGSDFIVEGEKAGTWAQGRVRRRGLGQVGPAGRHHRFGSGQRPGRGLEQHPRQRVEVRDAGLADR